MAYFPVSLTMQDAQTRLPSGLAEIAGGAAEIDLSRLEHFDSAAMAVLLAWRRAAELAGVSLRITGAPPGVLSLANLYGIGELVQA